MINVPLTTDFSGFCFRYRIIGVTRFSSDMQHLCWILCSKNAGNTVNTIENIGNPEDTKSLAYRYPSLTKLDWH